MRNAISTLTTVLLLSQATMAAGQGVTQPFVRPNEELVFKVRSSRLGDIGTATMRVDADTVNGREAYRLSFDFSARVALFRVSDRTRSWLDRETLTTLRYQKCERSPLGSRDEDVRVFDDRGIWSDNAGDHALASPQPLDELAFIYLVRALVGTVHEAPGGTSIDRHFDERRNSVRFLDRGRTRVAAFGDSVTASVIQMDARDSRQKQGTTRLTFYIGDDAARLPLRIVTSMPVAGALTMTLQSVTVNDVSERSTPASGKTKDGSANGRQK